MRPSCRCPSSTPRSGSPCHEHPPEEVTVSSPFDVSATPGDAWLPVAPETSVAEPGSFVVADVDGESIVVVRGRDDVVRGFYNVCQHRGTAVAEEACGKAIRFQCPLHAWIYDLDGRLTRAKHPEDLQH